ncbi:hypothetical protein OSH11_13445 [Kaistia dalseonensis]|uniref:Histidine phosphotransferase ChpT C-terminal domain-containing protein n=1 Tax=Kaistia dalseonensis TaxID=410840 RepID=A0ABU0H982_9HYPH|nr:hypothetical protein [Kaistia dalseonensis]MCX5495714.1 hypothetical protein [Kaistia dalseonensis]MDQ0438310.1 hypothetical protein [Kaistia dalseonensis]
MIEFLGPQTRRATLPDLGALFPGADRSTTESGWSPCGPLDDLQEMINCLSSTLALMRLRIRRAQSTDLEPLIDDAEQATARAGTLARGLAPFLGNSLEAPEPADVNEIVLTVGRSLDEAGFGGGLQFALAQALPPVHRDTDEISGALLQGFLLFSENAAHAKSAPIRVETCRAILRAPHGELAPGAYICVGIGQVLPADRRAGGDGRPAEEAKKGWPKRSVRRLSRAMACLEGHVETRTKDEGRAIELYFPIRASSA